MAYFYPDIADQITLDLILLNNINVEALEQSENVIFASAENLFQKNRFGSLLDLGCGKGRLTSKFSKYFNTVTALDPDRWRLEQAIKNLGEKNIRNVEYVEAFFQDTDFPDDYYDVVICNQMIQHIDTNTIQPIIQEILRILKTNGILLLTTSYSEKNADYFLKSYFKNGSVETEEIGEIEFNRLMTNHEKILPIHYFSKRALKKYVSGFKEITLSIYDRVFPHPMLNTILFMGKKPGP